MTEITATIDYGDRGAVHIVPDGAALARTAAEMLVAAVERASSARGKAFIALSGGSTPKQMGQLLATGAYRDRVNWAATEFFWGDERWVPLDSADSNAGEAMRGFLNNVPVPAEQVHAFDTANVTPEVSAARYEALIRERIPADVDLPTFDLIFLGMGEDGHTASLFPGTEAIHERKRLVVSHYVPKLDTIRLTMTPPLLNAGREVVFLAGGAGKAERLAEVLDGPEQVDVLPSQVIRPAGGPIWLVDQAAAALLARRPR